MSDTIQYFIPDHKVGVLDVTNIDPNPQLHTQTLTFLTHLDLLHDLIAEINWKQKKQQRSASVDRWHPEREHLFRGIMQRLKHVERNGLRRKGYSERSGHWNNGRNLERQIDKPITDSRQRRQLTERQVAEVQLAEKWKVFCVQEVCHVF